MSHQEHQVGALESGQATGAPVDDVNFLDSMP